MKCVGYQRSGLLVLTGSVPPDCPSCLELHSPHSGIPSVQPIGPETVQKNQFLKCKVKARVHNKSTFGKREGGIGGGGGGIKVAKGYQVTV